MGEYTEILTTGDYVISSDDDDYTEKLAEIARSFRPFSAALDEFISSHGYDGDMWDTKAKIGYIKKSFNDAGIEIDVRNIKKWYENGTRSDDRTIAFKFCFAFGLSIEETQDFFRRVYLQRGIDCHDVDEAVYYYSICHRLSYTEAAKLIEEAPRAERKRLDFEDDVLFTSSIISEIDRFDTSEQLMMFLNDNISRFGYNNAAAYKLINEVWRIISQKGGVAEKEAVISDRFKVRENRSVWDIYTQIFGYEWYEKDKDSDKDTEKENYSFSLKEYDRTIRPLLERSGLLAREAIKYFPDRRGLEDIVKGIHKDNEMVRKTIILLVFYKFFASQIIRTGKKLYEAAVDDADRCRAEIDNYLMEAGYPEMYEGNPYDWIFLAAMCDEDPLAAFRSFMAEVYIEGTAG